MSAEEVLSGKQIFLDLFLAWVRYHYVWCGENRNVVVPVLSNRRDEFKLLLAHLSVLKASTA